MQRHSNNLVVISVTPSLLDFVAYEAEDGLKDAVRNILESKEYVINAVREAMANQVQICSENFPPSVSEVTEVGFDTLSSSFVMRTASRSLQCRLRRRIQFGHQGSHTHLIVEEIIATRCADGVVSGHRMAHQAMNSLGRIAGRSYCRTGDKFNV